MRFILLHLSLIAMTSDLLLPLSQILLAQEQEHTQNTSVKIPVAVNDGSVPWPSPAEAAYKKKFCAVLSVLCGCAASE